MTLPELDPPEDVRVRAEPNVPLVEETVSVDWFPWVTVNVKVVVVEL